MACPSCGSTDLHQIAPNWFRCAATWQRQFPAGGRPIFGPGRFGAVIGEVPIYTVETVTCGVRHHRIVRAASGPWPLCECGTYAIGVCKSCDDPICGDDSTRVDWRRLCLRCAANAKSESERRRADQERRDREEHRRAEEERRRAEEERLNAKAQERAEEIARHGPCRAYPRHPANYTDAGGNCRACVVGLR